MASAAAQIDQRDSAFLTKLPPENRNRIYDLIFLHEAPLNVVKYNHQTDNSRMARKPGKCAT